MRRKTLRIFLYFFLAMGIFVATGLLLHHRAHNKARKVLSVAEMKASDFLPPGAQEIDSKKDEAFQRFFVVYKLGNDVFNEIFFAIFEKDKIGYHKVLEDLLIKDFDFVHEFIAEIRLVDLDHDGMKDVVVFEFTTAAYGQGTVAYLQKARGYQNCSPGGGEFFADGSGTYFLDILGDKKLEAISLMRDRDTDPIRNTVYEIYELQAERYELVMQFSDVQKDLSDKEKNIIIQIRRVWNENNCE